MKHKDLIRKQISQLYTLIEEAKQLPNGNYLAGKYEKVLEKKLLELWKMENSLQADCKSC